MRNELGEMLLKEPFLTLSSYDGRLLAFTLRLGVLRIVFEATGGAGLQVRGAPGFSSSTITTIQTPI
jgi:hypothetical protein